MLKSTLYLFQRFLCLCVCSSCRKAASCPCSSFDTVSELDVTRHQTMDRKFSINLYDAPSWQTSNDWTYFISDSSFLIRVLSVWARFNRFQTLPSGGAMEMTAVWMFLIMDFLMSTCTHAAHSQVFPVTHSAS